MILFVGRIQPLKAPDVLIKGVAELARRSPERRAELKLIIIGSPSGPDSGWSRTLAPLTEDLGVTDLVDFRPHSERAELFRWYCASDVVGVPSYNESFGLVALEAQACGRPVVATDVGGLRHTVQDQQTGLLVAGPDPNLWADALGSVIDHPGRTGPDGRQRGRPRVDVQLGQHRGRDVAGVRTGQQLITSRLMPASCGPYRSVVLRQPLTSHGTPWAFAA